MGKRIEHREVEQVSKIVTRTVYDCDGGCGNENIKVGSRIQYGTNQQSGESFRRYLCLPCTGELKGWLGMRNAETTRGNF